MKTHRTLTIVSALLITAVLSLSNALGDTVEKKAKEAIIPLFKLQNSTPAEAFAAISSATGIKVFYLPRKDDQASLSFSLQNIPTSEALKYVTGLANLKITYKEDGVHVQSAGQ